MTIVLNITKQHLMYYSIVYYLYPFKNPATTLWTTVPPSDKDISKVETNATYSSMNTSDSTANMTPNIIICVAILLGIGVFVITAAAVIRNRNDSDREIPTTKLRLAKELRPLDNTYIPNPTLPVDEPSKLSLTYFNEEQVPAAKRSCSYPRAVLVLTEDEMEFEAPRATSRRKSLPYNR